MFPDANVRAIPAGDGGVAIVGYVDNPQSITAILDLAEKFYPGGVINGFKAVGPQQVQLRVMIAEVNRTQAASTGRELFQSADHDRRPNYLLRQPRGRSSVGACGSN